MAYDAQKSLLKDAFLAAVEAVQPHHFMTDVAAAVTARFGTKPVTLMALGKAAGAMADAYLATGAPVAKGLVVLPHDVPTALPDHFTIYHSAHPVPDAASQQAGEALLNAASALGPDDAAILLLSGGGSALACVPPPPLSLAEKQQVNEALLASGAPIQEMNIVRKHLSLFKGGRLAAASFPAPLLCFALSDVPGDEPAAIASGPAVADPSSRQDAAAILAAYQIATSPAVTDWLANPASESPFAEDDTLSHSAYHLIGSATIALLAAARIVEAAGYHPVMLGDHFQDNARDLAAWMAAEAEHYPDGTALISGGETSVKVTGTGRGGRNAEFAHALALHNHPRLVALSGDSDGIDGADDVAASLIAPDTLARAEAASLDAKAMLANNDSHRFFAGLSDQLITGPTQTNVNDIRIILIGTP